MTNLIINEHPLIVLPSLAEKIGLNEAIALQQLHYWTKDSNKVIEGNRWTYNTYDGWLKQFPFWSKSTVRRTLTSLEKQNLIFTGNFNKMKADKTKWYSVNYQTLFNMSSPCVQNEQSMCSKWTDGNVQNEQSNTLDLPKTSSETSTDIPYVEIVTYLNDAAGTQYKHSTKKTQSLIKARWNEGFNLADFKNVIDTKVNEWLHDRNMKKYLRPETLFSPKFEGYLNQDDQHAPSNDPYDNLF